MKVKKVTVILIAILFVLAVLGAVFFIFTLKKVDVNYALSEGYDNSEITQTLNEFNGKNLLFFDLEEVATSLKKFPDIKVLSVKKEYPGVLSVSIAERLPAFNLFSQGKTYTLDKEGFIIKINDGQIPDSREIIDLKFDGLTLESKSLGERLVCSDDLLFTSAIEMANEVDLADSIKTLVVKKDSSGEMKDVEFYTYTGVKITVIKADHMGVEKIKEAFNSYDSVTVDFIKSYSEIIVYLNDEGKIDVDWIS